MTHTPDDEPLSTASQQLARSRAVEAFWTLFVALPAAFSILRLWVESGGQLQTTLLLVGDLGATNLVPAMFITGTPLVTAGFVAVLGIGSVLGTASDYYRPSNHPRDRPPRPTPLLARWAEAMPWWLIATSFVLALATWKILYLPFLAPAAVASVQRANWYKTFHDPYGWRRACGFIALLAGYGWLIAPTILDAEDQHEPTGILLLTAPVLLAPLVTGPVGERTARLLAFLCPSGLLVLLIWAAAPVLSTPILPLTVTVTNGTHPGDPVEYIRGNVIATTDVNMVILQEKGGARYVPNSLVVSQVLCATDDELPRYRIRIHDFHVEDSLLGALGRKIRPVTITDAACRVA